MLHSLMSGTKLCETTVSKNQNTLTRLIGMYADEPLGHGRRKLFRASLRSVRASACTQVDRGEDTRKSKLQPGLAGRKAYMTRLMTFERCDRVSWRCSACPNLTGPMLKTSTLPTRRDYGESRSRSGHPKVIRNRESAKNRRTKPPCLERVDDAQTGRWRLIFRIA
jgi:hypothetical protein